jgi:hypothetical protein
VFRVHLAERTGCPVGSKRKYQKTGNQQNTQNEPFIENKPTHGLLDARTGGEVTVCNSFELRAASREFLAASYSRIRLRRITARSFFLYLCRLNPDL